MSEKHHNKNIQMTSIWKDVSCHMSLCNHKLKQYCTALRMVKIRNSKWSSMNSCSFLWECKMGGPLKKADGCFLQIKCVLSIQHSCHAPWCLSMSESAWPHANLYKEYCWSFIHNFWRFKKKLPFSGWMKTLMWYSQRVECYSMLKRN
jgi:hypothetical protein